MNTSPAEPLRIYGNLSLVEMAPVLLAIERYYDGPVHLAHGGVMALWGEGSELASLASSGQADIALNTETQALRGAARHPDMRFIFTVGECPYRIVARRSAGIATLADLRGKRVGTQIDSSADYCLDALLNTVGLGLANVIRVPFMMKTEKPLTLLPEALQAGEIDAVAMWEPQVARAQRLIGEDAVEFYDPDVYTEKFSLCTTQGKLGDPAMRARIVAFTRALIEASRQLRVDPQTGWDLVAKTSGLDHGTIRDAWGYYQFPATLTADTLDFCARIEPWIAALEDRKPNRRDGLAALMDGSVVKEARAIAVDWKLRADVEYSRDTYMSCPVAKGRFVSLTKRQFDEISSRINMDQSLVVALDDFRLRWIAANESDDPNAFAGNIDRFDTVCRIVGLVTGDPATETLAPQVVLRYLELR